MKAPHERAVHEVAHKHFRDAARSDVHKFPVTAGRGKGPRGGTVKPPAKPPKC